MSAPRKLAAILAADVVGYSRLTGLDEEGTLKRLRKRRRELINPAVALHRGRIVKTTAPGQPPFGRHLRRAVLTKMAEHQRQR